MQIFSSMMIFSAKFLNRKLDELWNINVFKISFRGRT